MEQINESRLRMAVDAIAQKPESWDQHTWASYSLGVRERLVKAGVQDYLTLPEGVTCGTSMCLAGQVVSQAGMKILWWPGVSNADLCFDPDTQKVEEIMTKAKELLGLTSVQAERVFSANAAKLTYEEMANEDCDDEDEPREDDIDRFKRNITYWTGVQFEEAAA